MKARIFIGLGICLLAFILAPLHRYSCIGLYPNGQGGSITQPHAVAPGTFVSLSLMSSRQVSDHFLTRNDIDLPDAIAVHVTCPPGQDFSLMTLEYRIDKDWIVHPRPLQVHGDNLTNDNFVCVILLNECRLPPMKSLDDLAKVQHLTIRATVKDNTDPKLPTYSVQEDFVLSTFKQNSPLWWTWIRF